MSDCPPIFIPFYGSILESPLVHVLIESHLPFSIVTHDSNKANADAVTKTTSKVTIYFVEGADKTYSSLLNAIRVDYAPKSGWFWLIHPAVSGFISISSRNQRGKSGGKENHGKRQSKSVCPLDGTIALAYRFPISHYTTPGKDSYSLVDLFLHDSQTHVKIEETDFIDPPFVMCLNTAAIPPSIQFRGHLNEIRDFKLQLLAESALISTPNTFSAETCIEKQFFHFQERAKYYGIDSRRIDEQNFALRARWGKHLCSVVSNLHVHENNSLHANTVMQIRWSQCKNTPPKERIVVAEPRLSNEPNRTQQPYGSLNTASGKVRERRRVTFAETDVDKQTFQNEPQLSDEVIASQSGENVSHGHNTTSVTRKEKDCTQSQLQDNTRAELVPKETSEVESLSMDIHTLELPPANIRQAHVDTLSASMQNHRLVVDCADAQSVRALCIAYILDDLQRALNMRPAPASSTNPLRDEEFLVGVHFDDASQSIEVSWNEMSCKGTMDNIEDSKMTIVLLQDDRIRKVCLGTNDLYRRILMQASAPEVFRPRNTYDISLATFFTGNRRDPKKDFIRDSTHRLNDTNREGSSFISGLVSIFINYSTFLWTEEVFDGFAVANQAICAMASMECTGMCFDTRRAMDVKERMQKLLRMKILPEHLHCALKCELDDAQKWIPSAQGGQHTPPSELDTIHHTEKITTTWRAHKVFSSDLPSHVDFSLDGEDAQSEILIPSFRTAIVAPRGMVLLELDFPALELQVFALLADEPTVMDLSQAGADMYSFLNHARKSRPMNFHEALVTFKSHPVSAEDRRVLQHLIAGCIYGTTLTSLSARCRLRWEELQEFTKIFHALFPSVAKYQKKVSAACISNGAVSTIGGARELFPPSSESCAMELDENALHRAMRFIVQGSVRDFINSQLVEIENLRHLCDPMPFHLVMQANEKIFLYVDERFFFSVIPRLWKRVTRWRDSVFYCTFKYGYSLADMHTVDPPSCDGIIEDTLTVTRETGCE